jgi:peptide chain release factor 2
MLMRMYVRWANAQGYKTEVLDQHDGEEAGIKSCTLQIKGHNAYGKLKTESGVHRLVRISPYDSNARRHTSFASAWAYPVVDDNINIEISEGDVKVDTFRASGAGGQHVNKTDSAVRVTHVPTGLFVACQAERSQVQNKATAMSMLAAKLQQMKESERLDELKDLKGERGTIAWGHQIRSYVMMPYQMVKDLRTGHSTSRIQDVLDGDVQEFLDAYLRWVIAGRPDRKAQAGDDE